MDEIWKDIPGYEGLYEVSNYGRIRSLERLVKNGASSSRLIKSKLISLVVDGVGYYKAALYKEHKHKTISVHRIVLLAFSGKSDLTVDHLNRDKKDNRLCNLEYVTQRENSTRWVNKNNTTSQYTGVHWSKRAKKWRAQIVLNKKNQYLGLFDSELDASKAYKKALRKENV